MSEWPARCGDTFPADSFCANCTATMELPSIPGSRIIDRLAHHRPLRRHPFGAVIVVSIDAFTILVLPRQGHRTVAGGKAAKRARPPVSRARRR